MMDTLIEYPPALPPLILLEPGLAMFALIHLIRHPQVRIGNEWIWILVVLFLQSLGLILYAVIDREKQQQ